MYYIKYGDISTDSQAGISGAGESSSKNLNNQQGYSTPSNFKITIPCFDPDKSKDNISSCQSNLHLRSAMKTSTNH